MSILEIAGFLKWKYFRVKGGFATLSTNETINYILEHKSSICRFGDGEFSLMKDKQGPRFQQYDCELDRRLTDILRNHSVLPLLLICVPHAFSMENDDLSYKAKLFWNRYIKHFPLSIYRMMYGGLFGDAHITRPYMDYIKTENRYIESGRVFTKLKCLWRGRSVLVVEGEKSRLGVGNDLFNDCLKVSRILCPPENAWKVYNSILKTTEKEMSSYEIIVIALGPTATVLAYDLALRGAWALDIGHVDVEYEWFNKRSQKKGGVTK